MIILLALAVRVKSSRYLNRQIHICSQILSSLLHLSRQNNHRFLQIIPQETKSSKKNPFCSLIHQTNSIVPSEYHKMSLHIILLIPNNLLTPIKWWVFHLKNLFLLLINHNNRILILHNREFQYNNNNNHQHPHQIFHQTILLRLNHLVHYYHHQDRQSKQIKIANLKIKISQFRNNVTLFIIILNYLLILLYLNLLVFS